MHAYASSITQSEFLDNISEVASSSYSIHSDMDEEGEEEVENEGK